MIKNFTFGFCIAGAALILSGCEALEDDVTSNSDNTITRDGNVELVMKFAVDSAVAFIANADITEGTRSLETGLFEYRIIGGSRSRMGISERTELSRDSNDESEVVGSNLLALDAEGDLKPAMETNYPTKVMYSVGSPSGDMIYLALDPGWFDSEQTVDSEGRPLDFTKVIAESKCALLEVTVATNEDRCVAEKLFVQNMNDDYRQTISGNQKPIQFDGAGNLYFAGTSFSVQEDSSEACVFDEAAQQEVCDIQTNKRLDSTVWQPRIYRRLVGEDTATAITQDNELIDFFSVLKSGEVVYQSLNETTLISELKMLQGNSVIDISSGWGLDFFTVDDNNAVIFGASSRGSDENGLRFARPRAAGGVEKASLDTSLFGADINGSGWGKPTPRRSLVSDNGRIYGVFEGGRDTVDANGVNTGWEDVISVYQILPFDGIPKLELVLSDGASWWSWMQNTPFQVSNDTLYYTDSVDVDYLGTADVIMMVDLNTRLQTQVLTPTADGLGRYEIYNWRLSGDELYFSGLKKDNNTVVTGVINTKLFTSEADSSVYLTVTESASASGAASAIQDIEVIRAVSIEIDLEEEPDLTFFQSMDNLYSMSIDFSATMNTASVETNLSLVDGASNPIDLMKIWLNKTLHLIPDLDGLSDSTGTTPLAVDTLYTLTVAAGAEDVFGNALSTDSNQSKKTRPNSGWYIDNNDQDGNTLLYAGRGDGDSVTIYSTYDLAGEAIPDNFEVVFTAKNFDIRGPGIRLSLFDLDSDLPQTWQRSAFSMSLSGWSYLEYGEPEIGSYSTSISTPDILNGTWKTYRIRAYGQNLTVETKVMDAVDSTYKMVDVMTATDLAVRTNSNYTLLLQVSHPIAVKEFIINALYGDDDSPHSLGEFNLEFYNDDYSDGNVPSGFDTNLSDLF